MNNDGWDGKVISEIDVHGQPKRLKTLPKPGTLESLGIGIYSADPENDELDLIEGGGWSIARMIINWNQVEKAQGEYNFNYGGDWPVGVLHERWSLQRAKRTLFILDDVGANSPNSLYGARWSQEWQDGFVNYAGAAAARFAGGDTMYEITNEPFADPIGVSPSVYVDFATRVAQAIRTADPDAKIVGPAVSPLFAPEYLKAWFQEGLLDVVDAVSLHPYTFNGPPEQIVSMYADVRDWMQTYGGKVIPIMASETGWYTGTNANSVSFETQADYLARYHLINLSQDISGSLQFSFRNSGTDTSDPDQNYGVMDNHNEPVLGDAKPGYAAMQLLVQSLSGKEFSTKLNDGFSTDWLLVFAAPNGDETLAAWTTQVGGRTVNVPGFGTLELTSTPMYVIALPGDYNGDGQVGAADYVVWRNSVGQTGAGLAADGDRNQVVNGLDYDFWRARFGNSAETGSGSETAAAVPEPFGLTLVVIAFSTLVVTGRRCTGR